MALVSHHQYKQGFIENLGINLNASFSNISGISLEPDDEVTKIKILFQKNKN